MATNNRICSKMHLMKNKMAGLDIDMKEKGYQLWSSFDETATNRQREAVGMDVL